MGSGFKGLLFFSVLVIGASMYQLSSSPHRQISDQDFLVHADKRRSFALPTDAKEEGINAKLVNGVLTVDV
jgi:hypothetical protein